MTGKFDNLRDHYERHKRESWYGREAAELVEAEKFWFLEDCTRAGRNMLFAIYDLLESRYWSPVTREQIAQALGRERLTTWDKTLLQELIDREYISSAKRNAPPVIGKDGQKRGRGYRLTYWIDDDAKYLVEILRKDLKRELMTPDQRAAYEHRLAMDRARHEAAKEAEAQRKAEAEARKAEADRKRKARIEARRAARQHYLATRGPLRALRDDWRDFWKHPGIEWSTGWGQVWQSIGRAGKRILAAADDNPGCVVYGAGAAVVVFCGVILFSVIVIIAEAVASWSPWGMF
jgi:hypothetical protein